MPSRFVSRDLDDDRRLALRTVTFCAPSGNSPQLRLVHRNSDGSHKKGRFPFATKETCLRNFLEIFRPSREGLLIIADNVGEATWRSVNALHENVVRTTICHGAGSRRFGAFDVALAKCATEDAVYFVEGDYLHLPGSAKVLREGIAIGDYVTLYDHPDKYLSARAGGPNPYVAHGGELTRVIRTRSAHWKVTNSTTMTFAAMVRMLREDRDVRDGHASTRHPFDFKASMDLCQKGRSLLSPLPGYSTHCEVKWASPGVDWEAVALGVWNPHSGTQNRESLAGRP